MANLVRKGATQSDTDASDAADDHCCNGSESVSPINGCTGEAKLPARIQLAAWFPGSQSKGHR
eukprot:3100422-Pyramimonas_sp.AAC.1